MIAAALAAALGPDAVTRTDEGDPDERTAAHLSGQSIGRPRCWVRPSTAEAVVEVVKIAAAAGVAVVPVGGGTAYWDPLRLDGAVALDVRALSAPLHIDEVSRVARAAAGLTVRQVDRAARARGLCLAARPDAGGDTPVGALLAVGSTAGLGLGVAAPIDLVAGATVVTGRGDLARLGASFALHAAPFARHGAPEALGLVAAAEGRGAIVVEVGLLLHPAPFVVTVRGRGRAELPRLLAIARDGLDRGRLESLRIEVLEGLEVMARTLGRAGAAEALEEAQALAARLRAVGLAVDEPEVEPEAARRGEEPAYAYHWAFPEGAHRARLRGGALWGVEVGASWREAEACAARLWQLYRDLDGLGPRRFALYPAAHAVTVGVQATLPRDARLAPAIARMKDALPDLLAHGAVPYRAGHLWRAALDAHGAPDLAADLLDAIDPAGVVAGGARRAPAARAVDAALVDEVARRYREAIERGAPATATDRAPAPCLSLALRPPPPVSAQPIPAAAPPLPAPCDGCGAAAACEVARRPADGPRPLRPLRHAEAYAAARAALRRVAGAWQRRVPDALDERLALLVEERRGARALAPPPFELSLKIAGGALLPLLRVVEYSATGAWRNARARERARSAERLAGPEAGELLALVQAHQPEGMEVSIGFEAPLDGGAPATQLYAHLDPRRRDETPRLLRQALAWAAGGAPPEEEVAPLDALLSLSAARPVELTLLAFCPRPGDPRRLKLYFSVPLDLAHPPSGLTPAAPGPLAPYAPKRGLAVLEQGAAGRRWRKHDFPCAVHFQRAEGLARDFGAGLPPEDAARLARILDGEAFAPWPTWLSVSPSGRALYFVPR